MVDPAGPDCADGLVDGGLLLRKLRLGGSEVDVIGLNKESLDLFERIGGNQEPAHI